MLPLVSPATANLCTVVAECPDSRGSHCSGPHILVRLQSTSQQAQKPLCTHERRRGEWKRGEKKRGERKNEKRISMLYSAKRFPKEDAEQRIHCKTKKSKQKCHGYKTVNIVCVTKICCTMFSNVPFSTSRVLPGP